MGPDVREVDVIQGTDELAHALEESWMVYLTDGGRCACRRCVRDAMDAAVAARRRLTDGEPRIVVEVTP